jgi:hypothetical protein
MMMKTIIETTLKGQSFLLPLEISHLTRPALNIREQPQQTLTRKLARTMEV